MNTNRSNNTVNNATSYRAAKQVISNRFKMRKIAYLLGSTLIAVGIAACSSTETENRANQSTQTSEQELIAVTQQKAVSAEREAVHERLNRQTQNQSQKQLGQMSQLFTLADSVAPSPGHFSPKTPSNPAYTEHYQHLEENQVFSTAVNPLSTFSIDVDTGSYSNARRMLNQGWLPPADAIRVEEFVNYFDYQYPLTHDQRHPFAIDTQVSTSPWHSGRMLMRIGLKAHGQDPQNNQKELGAASHKNLVFLLDVSGSMNSANKLPLVKRALNMLTKQLTSDDSVAIVVYAGASGVVLEPTAANQGVKIEQALNRLSAGGSTNGGEGIEVAYKLAKQSFKDGGVNRVILATDGDFNVGMVNQQQLIELVEKQKEQGIELTTLGFGQGNYNDHLMEQLANKGNGNYAYIDTLQEARKVLVDELDATLQSVARDVKIQVEFNPNTVAEYRLIGYENRALKQEDFNNDNVDAGEIGAGHTVTAFYEVVLQGGEKFNDDLRYQQNKPQTVANNGNELAHVKLRYKPMNDDQSVLIEQVIHCNSIIDFAAQTTDFKFATSVVSFAQLLKNSKYTTTLGFDQIIELANNNKGKDDYGYRAEFVSLVRMAKILETELSGSSHKLDPDQSLENQLERNQSERIRSKKISS